MEIATFIHITVCTSHYSHSVCGWNQLFPQYCGWNTLFPQQLVCKTDYSHSMLCLNPTISTVIKNYLSFGWFGLVIFAARSFIISFQLSFQIKNDTEFFSFLIRHLHMFRPWELCVQSNTQSRDSEPGLVRWNSFEDKLSQIVPWNISPGLAGLCNNFYYLRVFHECQPSCGVGARWHSPVGCRTCMHTIMAQIKRSRTGCWFWYMDGEKVGERRRGEERICWCIYSRVWSNFEQFGKEDKKDTA